jgi:hypothetical protein
MVDRPWRERIGAKIKSRVRFVSRAPGQQPSSSALVLIDREMIASTLNPSIRLSMTVGAIYY